MENPKSTKYQESKNNKTCQNKKYNETENSRKNKQLVSEFAYAYHISIFRAIIN